MKGEFIACLDSCVLCPPALCDIRLRLAEHPRLYRPVFSMAILDEVERNQTTKFKRLYSEEKAASWRKEVLTAFPEALVEHEELLIPVLTNHEKDRHVLAAGIKGQSQVIVTANLKHFKEVDLAPWNIEALHPQSFLLTLSWLAVSAGALGTLATLDLAPIFPNEAEAGQNLLLEIQICNGVDVFDIRRLAGLSSYQ